MSDEEEEIQNEEDEDEENQDQQQQADEEDEEQDGDDEDDEDEQGDQDEDEQNDDEEEQDGENQQDQSKSQQQANVPSFKPVSQQFVFKNLIAQIASIGNSVDHFINTLPSRGGSAYRSYQPRIQLEYKPRVPDYMPAVQQKKYTIMKDQDIQVSMQPQIVIQQTLTPKQIPKKQPYQISNESTKFLAQLYEENKKLKRWQNTQSGSYSNTWYKSKQKFQRPEHERGLINLQDRNKQIDQAIEMLRRQNNQNE